MMTPTQFLEKMMALSGRFHFRVKSYYRSPKSNAYVGGVKNSFHQLWLAADIVLEDPNDENNFIFVARRLGLKVIVETDHIHIQAP